MGGQIGVESAPGQGSLFWFTVPFSAADNSSRDDSPSGLHGVPALVTSSHPLLGETLVSMLQRAGMQAHLARDGAAALAALRSASRHGAPFRILVADRNVGGMTQAELVAEVKADAGLSTTNVVVLSAPGDQDGDPPDPDADGYVSKPVRHSALLDCLARALAAESSSGAWPPPPPSSQGPETSAGRILVVEDNAVNQKVAVAILERLGYSTEVAGDGLDALEALARRRYDIVLMDCQMPRMDGFEATTEIRRRENGHRTPIVAMTASAMASDREHCLAVGMDDHLAKPVRREALAAVLRRWARGGPDPSTVAADSADLRTLPATAESTRAS